MPFVYREFIRGDADDGLKKRYAGILRLKKGTDTLVWESSADTQCLMVCVGFERDVSEYMNQLLDELEPEDLSATQYLQLLPDVQVLMTNTGHCPLYRKCCTYYVFACDPEREVIFKPKDIKDAQCSVPVSIAVKVEKEYETKWIMPPFLKKTVFTGFHCIRFPDGLDEDYRDGDICYRLGNLHVPVTQRMMQEGCVYMLSDEEPHVYSAVGAGVKIV